ncbi:ParB-like nuclease domain protein [Arthrobacter phage SilentRX]|uniref:ParB-like nuclease domain protein n=1 Tax=Arthrobacter phage SilentRX TaxID=2836091 RepID=A0A8F3EBI9_9CAUD|nr:ParB-like nuclease domain protein [Arthrobacter phage SilentRX]QWY82754.1 ParB-like nuclease domain protein [Arthrobacter phage SilentRX]
MKAVRFSKGVEPLLVPIDQVKQHPDNPNNGDDENLVESIQVNGFVTAVTADVNTGYIVAGNTRYRALLALGATQIPVIWEDRWNAEGAVRYMVGDNASARRAVMDEAALIELLGQLAETERGLQGTSITQPEYEKMLMDFANSQDMPDTGGFGGQPEMGALGLYQVIVEFEGDRDERDVLFAELAERYPEKVRVANL